MSTLGQAVAAKTGRAEADVDAVLARHGVDVSASSPAPSRLVVTRLSFSGTKTLTGIDADGVPGDVDDSEEVPFEFDWDLGTGLFGIGSDLNLRGKSSILHLIMWALRGRNDVRHDIAEWLEHVDLDFTVDDASYHVGFAIDEGEPAGQLTRTVGGVTTTVGTFTDGTQFGGLMGATMMEALRLPVIAAAVEGVRTQHSWPTYAGALLINGDTLQYLVGEHQWSGLPSRLLQMFVGADWSPVRAQAVTASKIARDELMDLQQRAAAHAAELNEVHQAALDLVAAVQARLDSLPTMTVEPSAVNDAIDRLAGLDGGSEAMQAELLAARGRVSDTESELRSAEAKLHVAEEDAIAVRFFQRMRPTVCPRCAAPVTEVRRAAEAEGAACSVCTSDLDLDELALDHVHAVNAAPSHQGEAEDLEETDPVADTEALRAAVESARRHLNTIEAAFEATRSERAAHVATITAAQADQVAATTRHEIEVELARAQGAADALAPSTAPTGPDPAAIEALAADVAVLRAAENTVTKWVTDAQVEPLAKLSDDITRLARSFGMSSLTAVELKGGATMQVTTGGAPENYGDCERGEKLRLKLATAIAMIRLSRSSGVGRHPGLLMVDSLAAEEIPENDFRAMLDALHSAADEAGIQIIIATRHTDVLESVLGADRCRLGRGTSFVW